MYETILKNLVRIGTVTATAPASRAARVKFQDTGVTSDWQVVLGLSHITACDLRALIHHTHRHGHGIRISIGYLPDHIPQERRLPTSGRRYEKGM